MTATPSWPAPTCAKCQSHMIQSPIGWICKRCNMFPGGWFA